jgi:N-acetylglucosaminyl-diphospho-decaprenol L-rhamnosyltransferase
VPTLSVLTITYHRTHHLINLLEGLARSSRLPDECVVVHMNEPVKAISSSHSSIQFLPFPCHHITCDTSTTSLPLAQARNAAAAKASGDILLFLDVDCIPGSALNAAYEQACSHLPESIAMGQVRYLQQSVAISWPETFQPAHAINHRLQQESAPHPKRDVSQFQPLSQENNYGLFWSISFALHRSLFWQLGGFSECYQGYGAEDTDFAWKARQQGVDLRWVPGAIAYHQFHEHPMPPWHHLEDIVKNAECFYRRWQEWPMSSWLSAFAQAGCIDWSPEGSTIKIVRGQHFPQKT